MSFNHTINLPSPKESASYPLWGVFDRLWTSAMGYHADEFKFVRGKTAFSTGWEVVGMTSLYLLVIFGGREFMRDRKPLQLNTLFKIHNFFLSTLSLGLLLLFIEQLAPRLWKYGFYDNICGDDAWTPQLVTLYYLNYITKYIELIDTVFLMVKKKPLTFLHCYHHPATALLCYTQLTGTTSVSWVPITLNLAVHVIMYWYYFQMARGVKVWWKEWITRFQITQFVIDLVVVYYASYTGIMHKYKMFNFMPHRGYCAGQTYAAFSGCAILSSYLVLFISFYIATYKRATKKSIKSTPKPAEVVDAAKKSATAMVNEGMDRKIPLLAEN
ncbi:Fen12 protein [Stachybotrys elegans]|uniref:Elongation of fatty acids protein n=1 Tax=Stachybotrys elegans TaxID=80388 RepID=A0A8K0WPC3_9HYPO|nr:Fen12 protein [Stachybotrys elegans]